MMGNIRMIEKNQRQKKILSNYDMILQRIQKEGLKEG